MFCNYGINFKMHPNGYKLLFLAFSDILFQENISCLFKYSLPLCIKSVLWEDYTSVPNDMMQFALSNEIFESLLSRNFKNYHMAPSSLFFLLQKWHCPDRDCSCILCPIVENRWTANLWAVSDIECHAKKLCCHWDLGVVCCYCSIASW